MYSIINFIYPLVSYSKNFMNNIDDLILQIRNRVIEES